MEINEIKARINEVMHCNKIAALDIRKIMIERSDENRILAMQGYLLALEITCGLLDGLFKELQD